MNGHDAFLSKSYLPGRGFVKVTQLTAGDRSILRGVKGTGKAKAAVKRALPPSPATRKIHPGIDSPKGKAIKFVQEHEPVGYQALARPNGRGGGTVHIAPSGRGEVAEQMAGQTDPDKHFTSVMNHEMQHIYPKRNVARLYERAKNPRMVGREEARADYMSGRDRYPYHPSPGHRKGYEEVQAKMKAAGTKRSRLNKSETPPKPLKFNGTDAEWAIAHKAAQERRAAQAAGKAARQETVAANTVKKLPLLSHINRGPATNVAVSATAAGAAFGLAHHRRQKAIVKRDNSDRNKVVGATAGGAGAGFIAAPGKQVGLHSVHPAIRDLPEGRHMVDPAHLVNHTSSSGVRIGDSAHVSRLARNLKQNGYDASKGPVRLNIYHGSAHINEGNHRVHAANVAGVKKVPVEIRRAEGKAPASSWRGGSYIDAARVRMQRNKYKSKVGNDKWMNSAKPENPKSFSSKFNARMARQGAEKAAKGNEALKTFSRAKYLRRNALMIGGGAAIAGTVAHHELHKRDKTNYAIAGVGGVAAADAAGVITGQAAKARIKIHRNRAGMTPAQEARWAQHKQDAGMAPGEKISSKTPHKVKDKIFSKYPKELPGWKAQRVLAYKNKPAVVAAGLTAGAGAAMAYEHHRQSKLHKGWNPVSGAMKIARGKATRTYWEAPIPHKQAMETYHRTGGAVMRPKTVTYYSNAHGKEAKMTTGGGLTTNGKVLTALAATGAAGGAAHIHGKHYKPRNETRTVKVKVKKGMAMDPFEISKIGSPMAAVGGSRMLRTAMRAQQAGAKASEAVKGTSAVKGLKPMGSSMKTAFQGMSKPAKIATVGGATAGITGSYAAGHHRGSLYKGVSLLKEGQEAAQGAKKLVSLKKVPNPGPPVPKGAMKTTGGWGAPKTGTPQPPAGFNHNPGAAWGAKPPGRAPGWGPADAHGKIPVPKGAKQTSGGWHTMGKNYEEIEKGLLPKFLKGGAKAAKAAENSKKVGEIAPGIRYNGPGQIGMRGAASVKKSYDPFEISKKKTIKPKDDPSFGRLASGAMFAPIHGAVAGKKGHKLQAAGYELAGGLVAGPAGSGVGTYYAHKAGYLKPQKKKR